MFQEIFSWIIFSFHHSKSYLKLALYFQEIVHTRIRFSMCNHWQGTSLYNIHAWPCAFLIINKYINTLLHLICLLFQWFRIVLKYPTSKSVLSAKEKYLKSGKYELVDSADAYKTVIGKKSDAHDSKSLLASRADSKKLYGNASIGLLDIYTLRGCLR